MYTIRIPSLSLCLSGPYTMASALGIVSMLVGDGPMPAFTICPSDKPDCMPLLND